MGNSIVHASSPDPQSPSPMADPLTANIDDVKDKTTSNNPGTLEELHKKCTGMLALLVQILLTLKIELLETFLEHQRNYIKFIQVCSY